MKALREINLETRPTDGEFTLIQPVLHPWLVSEYKTHDMKQNIACGMLQEGISYYLHPLITFFFMMVSIPFIIWLYMNIPYKSQLILRENGRCNEVQNPKLIERENYSPGSRVRTQELSTHSLGYQPDVTLSKTLHCLTPAYLFLAVLLEV